MNMKKHKVSKHQDFSELDYAIESEDLLPTASSVYSDKAGESRASVPGPSRFLLDFTKENNEKLPPKNQKLNDTALFMRCRKHMKRICDLRNRRSVKKLKGKELLNVLIENESVQTLLKKLIPSFALMLQLQLRNVKRKHTRKKWTMEEKIIALRLYKRSSTCYRLLQRLWCLPAPSTLKSLLNQFNLNTGIDNKIFNGLKKYIRKQNRSDNAYVLMFDEMAISKHGLQGTTQKEATYALVFMVAGITIKVKQPVAFYLSGSNVTSDRLAVLIKEVLNKCFEIGMRISATVCVMDGVNRRALTILGASKSQPYFNVGNNEVVAIFDPPHLLKCFRNLFLKYNINCTTNVTSDNRKGIAKWSHIQDFYDLDNTNPDFVFAPVLTKDHLDPNTKQKKKVNLAAQVMSHCVAVGMFAKIPRGELSADATTTAEVIANMDKLFDAVNSDTADLRRGKPHSTNMTSKSPHIKHFEEMKSFFQNLEFVGCRSSPPSKDGWIWTINGIVKIFHALKQKHYVRSLATRRLHLEPLKNLFGAIRANCGANSNPTSSQFIDGLKTTIITNVAHSQSGNNCEEDNYNTIITHLKDLFS